MNGKTLTIVRKSKSGLSLRKRRAWYVEAAPPITFDQAVIDGIQKPGLEAIAQVEKLAAATEYTHAYKHEAASKIMPEAVAATKQEAAEWRENLSKRVESLSVKVNRFPTLPADMDANRVQAVKDAMHALAGSIHPTELYSRWENALESDDKETAWVFQYHGETLIRRADKRTITTVSLDGVSSRPKPVNSQLPLGARYDKLKARTDDYLASPELRKVRAELREAQETLKRINGTENFMVSRLTGWRIDRDGFIDGQRVAMHKSVQF